LENLKKEMQKNAVFAVGVSEGQRKCQNEATSGDSTVYYFGGERAERGIAIVVHILRSLRVMTDSLFLS
jgi:hypothetical protein